MEKKGTKRKRDEIKLQYCTAVQSRRPRVINTRLATILGKWVITYCSVNASNFKTPGTPVTGHLQTGA